MKKQTTEAFGKTIYLLGEDEGGQKYWLEAPSWDCDWYWGFGYVETYTNNRSPKNSKDISSHQHINSSFIGENNAKDGGYCHNIYDSKLLYETTFTESEGWELSELFKAFYLLRDYASFVRKGSVGISSCEILKTMIDGDAEKNINKTLIPKITNRIIEILSPTK